MFPPIFRGLLHDTVFSLWSQGHDEWWNNKDLEESRRGLIDIPFRHCPPGQPVSRAPPWHKTTAWRSHQPNHQQPTLFSDNTIIFYVTTIFPLFGQYSENWCSILGRVRIVFFSTVSRPTVEYTQPPVQRANRGLIPQGGNASEG
jgi:hypothetical protein